MLRRLSCIAALTVRTLHVMITHISGMTALSDVRAVMRGVSALTLDRPLRLLGEEAGTMGHPVKVEADAVVMDQLHVHPQSLDLLVGAKGP